MRRKAGTLALVCAAALALAVPATAAATETREEYAAQVNPICEQANAELKKIDATLKRKLAKIGKARDPSLKEFLRVIDRVGKRSERVSRAREAGISAVAPAPGDEMIVEIWLANRAKLTGVQTRLGRKLGRLFLLTFDMIDIETGALKKPSRKLKRLVTKIERLEREWIRLSRAERTQANTLGVSACALEKTGQRAPIAVPVT